MEYAAQAAGLAVTLVTANKQDVRNTEWVIVSYSVALQPATLRRMVCLQLADIGA